MISGKADRSAGMTACSSRVRSSSLLFLNILNHYLIFSLILLVSFSVCLHLHKELELMTCVEAGDVASHVSRSLGMWRMH